MSTVTERNLYAEVEESGRSFFAVKVFADNDSSYPLEDWEDWIDTFDEAFCGQMSTDDFAAQLADELYLGGKDVPQWVVTYFDYEKFERDLFLGDYWESEGCIFRSI